MYKNRKTGEYMYPILDWDIYAISRGGEVGKSCRIPGNDDEYQDYIPIKSYLHHGSPYVHLYMPDKDKRFQVARLSVDSIYGELPFDIMYTDGDRLNLTKHNLYFDIKDFRIVENPEIDGETLPGKCLILIGGNEKCEVFRPLPDEYVRNYGRYWISNKGAIYDLSKHALISRSNDNKGYYKVAITIAGYKTKDGVYIKPTQITPKVHTLVYWAWAGPIKPGYTIDHKDGRRHNNRISNLEQVSFEENVLRMRMRNLEIPTVIHVRWTDEQIHTVCKCLEENKSYREIVEALGYDTSDTNSKDYIAVRNLSKAIIDGRTFNYISNEYDLSKARSVKRYGEISAPPQKFNPETVRKICEELVSGKGPAKVSRLFPEVSLGTIQGIKQGRQYKEIADTVPGMDAVIANRKKVNLESYKPENRIRWTDEEIHKICSAIEAGKSNQDISEMLGFGREPNGDNLRLLSNLIGSIYHGRLHAKISSQYKFPESRKDLAFPNAGRYLPGKKHNESTKEVS